MVRRTHNGFYITGLLLASTLGGTIVDRAYARRPVSRPETVSAASSAMSRLPQDHPGRRTFLQYCAPCHGPKGLGNGPAASAFKPPPANYTDPNGVPKMTDAQLTEVITKGKGSMPAWGPILKPEQITQLVAYIRELSRGEG